MNTQTLIIGGGLTGLSLAYRLQKAGHDYQLIEARNRFGGRIKSLTVQGANIDLGPSWVWPGQNRVAAMLDDLGLSMFAQFSTGTQLYEQHTGEVMQNAGSMSMAGSLRITGGTSALTDALAAKLDSARTHLNTAATAITDDKVTLRSGQTIQADTIVLCIPPRLAAQLNYTPPLPDAALSSLQSTPVWMGAHAKFVAVYDTPFWRNNGLSGDASSRRGPLAEIHDASPADGSVGALFGFMGLPAEVRAQAGPDLMDATMAQLENLFGAQAGKPISTHLEDWSQAPFTSTAADATPPPGHPPYLKPRTLHDVWYNKLIFAVTELTSDNGGLIEGALAASEDAASQILNG